MPDQARPLRVTLLVIAYRMRATIGAAVRSALAQTYPCDIIVSDDASGDGTLEAARAALDGVAGAERVSVRSTQHNLGLCAHLNELVALARGDIIVCASGDDESRPQRVARLVDAFVAHPQAQLVGSAVDDIDAAGNLLATATRGLPFQIDQRWLLRRGRLATVLGASMAFRRELVADLPPLAGSVEDNQLTLRAVLVGQCLCLAEPLLRYRLHGDNLNARVFDRSGRGYAGFVRRHRRVIAMYRDVASDQRRCVAARPELPVERRQLGLQLAGMYALEAEMREAILDLPRRQWLGPLWRGACHPGLRRKSLERALKLGLPRRWFGR